MRVVLDGKSVLIGGFAGVALVASLGAMQRDALQAGRFQIDAEPEPSAGTNAYVLDTATGRVWREHNNGSEAYVRFAEPKLDGEK